LLIIRKPWGKEILWAHTSKYVSKLLFINNKEQLSLQLHSKKDESMLILKGKVLVKLGKAAFTCSAGDFFDIPHGTEHRLTALEDVVVLEVSTPELDDIIRIADKYDRDSKGGKEDARKGMVGERYLRKGG